MRIKKRWIILSGLVVFLLVVLAVAWGPIVRSQVEKKLHQIPNRWGGSAGFSSVDVSFLTVTINDLVFFGSDSTTRPLFSSKRTSVTLGLGDLIAGKQVPERLSIDSAACYLFVHPESGRWNFQKPRDSLSAPVLTEIDTPVSFPELIEPASWLLHQISEGHFPLIDITRFSAEIRWGEEDLIVDEFTLRTGPDSLFVKLSGPEVHVFAEGVHQNGTTRIQLLRPARAVIPLPDAFALRFAASSGFLSLERRSDSDFALSAAVEAFMVDSRAISRSEIVFDYAALSSMLSFAENQLSASTDISINKVTLKQAFTYRETASLPVVSQSFRIEPSPAEDFRASFPESLIGALQNLDFSGKLGYELSTEIDFSQPDSLKLDAKVLREQFSLRNSGIHFDVLNGSYEQPVYDGLQIKRNVIVGNENPAYTSLSEIPVDLVNAVLTSEDVSFFNHRGFSPASFRSALADNIKARSFKRGASTISMQLVKNVFLTREKTIARKFQELIITWLLEESRIVSKESMLEVYFNIIEWGPDVYGIGEAAPFYFNKTPSELTLEECLFLSMIIPSPKRFTSRFKTGALRPSAIQNMEFVARKMVQFTFISQEAYDALDFSTFSLPGKAGKIVAPDEDEEGEEEIEFHVPKIPLE